MMGRVTALMTHSSETRGSKCFKFNVAKLLLKNKNIGDDDQDRHSYFISVHTEDGPKTEIVCGQVT